MQISMSILSVIACTLILSSQVSASCQLDCFQCDYNEIQQNSCYKSISEINSPYLTSNLSGKQVATVGIVTGVSQTGFYIQTPDVHKDKDMPQSNGLFVYTYQHNMPPLFVGSSVVVTGKVANYRYRGTQQLYVVNLKYPTWRTCTNLFTKTTITPSTLGSRLSPVPDYVYTKPLNETACLRNRSCPKLRPNENALDYYVSHLHTLVTIESPTVIQPTKNGKYSSTVVRFGPEPAPQLESSYGGVLRSRNPYTRLVAVSSALLNSHGYLVPVDQFYLGDTPKSGAITGVLSYSFGMFTILPTQPVQRPDEGKNTLHDPNSLLLRLYDNTQAPYVRMQQAKPNQLRIGTYNIENFNHVDADACERVQHLANDIVTRAGAPDIIALQEVQDNDGPKSSKVVAANQTYQFLINAIRQVNQSLLYTWTDIAPEVGQDGGMPGGNIRVGFLYNPDTVQLAHSVSGGPGGAEDKAEVVDCPECTKSCSQLNHNPVRIDPTNPAYRHSRKPLLAHMIHKPTSKSYFVFNVHLRSLLGGTPTWGAVQPPLTAGEDIRVEQLSAVRRVVNQLYDSGCDANVVVLGDFNDFHTSKAIQVLTVGFKGGKGQPVLRDLMWTVMPPKERWSYIHEGVSQSLDHVMLSQHLINSSSMHVIRGNAIVPSVYQVSDHEPHVVTIN